MAFLKLLSVYFMTEQTNTYIMDNESQISDCQNKDLKIKWGFVEMGSVNSWVLIYR